jgi:hypothetical protein
VKVDYPLVNYPHHYGKSPFSKGKSTISMGQLLCEIAGGNSKAVFGLQIKRHLGAARSDTEGTIGRHEKPS